MHIFVIQKVAKKEAKKEAKKRLFRGPGSSSVPEAKAVHYICEWYAGYAVKRTLRYLFGLFSLSYFTLWYVSPYPISGHSHVRRTNKALVFSGPSVRRRLEL
jgi:hypothetical protein